MREPTRILELNTSASLADVIEKTNEIIYAINFMWHPEESGSLE